MNWRSILRIRNASLVTVIFSGSFLIAAQNTERPNIIYIMSDDHAIHAISAYGSQITRTPNIDRVAAGGMRFENAFCTNSICTPSRAVILTGKYSHLNGVRTLEDVLNGFNQPTFPRVLQQSGYTTAVFGKWHLNSDPVGFDDWKVLPGQGDYFDPVMIEMGKKRKHLGYVTDIITDMALDFLRTTSRGKPFCLLLHHKAPHDMWEFDAKHAQLFEGTDIPEPPNLFEDLSTRVNALKRSSNKIGQRHTEFPHQTSALPANRRKHVQYQQFIKAYLRCVASVDDNVGRVLDYLDHAGLSDNTVVVYTSDQGVFLGEHGLFDKRYMYEESLRIPLLVRYPPEVRAGSVNSDMVLNLDFAKTFLDYAGISAPDEMQGHSLRPLLQGRPPFDWRNSMYYRYWMHLGEFSIPAHYGVRTQRYKLIYYYGRACGATGAIEQSTEPEWECFDLQDDPHEMKNVYNIASYQTIVRDLKDELRRLRKQVREDDCGSF